MVKDYSGSCIAINRRNRRIKITGFRVTDFFNTTKLTWKALGVVLFVSVIIGITSTIWYGWQVQLALDQLGQDQISHSKLRDENKLLFAQKNLMLTQDHMEKAARELGLFPPGKEQLRFP